MTNQHIWQRYQEYLSVVENTGLILDISRMNFSDEFLPLMEPHMQRAFNEMEKLENGAIANPDEGRMVGHYWLRNPSLAPTPEISTEIEFTLRAVKDFAGDIHDGTIVSPSGKRFTRFLLIGIGGSALGPQFLADALKAPMDRMRPFFFDNTDPEGMDAVLAEIGSFLSETLVIVISKSGGTKETRNGMLEAKNAWEIAGLHFARHAVAVTGKGSDLDLTAMAEGWLARFPMWDWVGGRSSVTSAVGLLPAALQGIDITALLEGAKECDTATRVKCTRSNPAALLSLMWYYATDGRGAKDMVLLPYKDRLLLFSRYLQQLIMESLGKERDIFGNIVNQGITVYGNKGSTDQHAYVQQLREGVHNFFVTFIEVLADREGCSLLVEPGVTAGDYLAGFLHGTRQALYEKGRESLTICIPKVDPRNIGVLIALYERAVGFYATLIDINAYDQPGVEAGKKAAGIVLDLQHNIVDCLRCAEGNALDAEEIAARINASGETETVFRILLHLSANKDHGITMTGEGPLWKRRFMSACRKQEL